MKKEEQIIHIILFIFTAGIGNVIYLICKYKKEYDKTKYYKSKIEHYVHFKKEGKFRTSIGRTLVKVTAHGGSCELCKKWEGKVLIDDVFCNGKQSDGNYPLLSQAIENGFMHNGCRHGLTTYYPELEEKD